MGLLNIFGKNGLLARLFSSRDSRKSSPKAVRGVIRPAESVPVAPLYIPNKAPDKDSYATIEQLEDRLEELQLRLDAADPDSELYDDLESEIDDIEDRISEIEDRLDAEDDIYFAQEERRREIFYLHNILHDD